MSPSLQTRGKQPSPGRFYQSGGTLQPDSPSYVQRQADTDLYDALLGGEFCYVLDPRHMGKSSAAEARPRCKLYAAYLTQHLLQPSKV